MMRRLVFAMLVSCVVLTSFTLPGCGGAKERSATLNRIPPVDASAVAEFVSVKKVEIGSTPQEPRVLKVSVAVLKDWQPRTLVAEVYDAPEEDGNRPIYTRIVAPAEEGSVELVLDGLEAWQHRGRVVLRSMGRP